jgi:hypothetical protein
VALISIAVDSPRSLNAPSKGNDHMGAGRVWLGQRGPPQGGGGEASGGPPGLLTRAFGGSPFAHHSFLFYTTLFHPVASLPCLHALSLSQLPCSLFYSILFSSCGALYSVSVPHIALNPILSPAISHFLHFPRLRKTD